MWIVLVVVMAHYLACNEGRLRDVLGVVVPGVSLVLPLLVLIMFQKDFGSTVILIGLTGVLMFVAGLQWRYLFSLGGFAMGGLALMIAIEPYRIRRLTGFLDPFADPDGAGFLDALGDVPPRVEERFHRFRQIYGAMVHSMDLAVGQVLNLGAAEVIDGQTALLVGADNGAQRGIGGMHPDGQIVGGVVAMGHGIGFNRGLNRNGSGQKGRIGHAHSQSQG